MHNRTRAVSIKDARRASPAIAGVRFYARRNQHGLAVGEVTDQLMGMPIEKARRFMQHGIVYCEPVSDFTQWGKDVGLWCTRAKRVHPVTLGQLLVAQGAMAAGTPEVLPALLSDEIPSTDDGALDDEGEEDADGAEGDDSPPPPANEPPTPPAPKKGRKSKQA